MSNSPVKRYFMMLVIIAVVVGLTSFIVGLASKPKAPSIPPLPGTEAGKPLPEYPVIRIAVTDHEGKKVPAAKVIARWTFTNGNSRRRVSLTDGDGVADLRIEEEDYSYFQVTVEPRNEPMIRQSFGRRNSRKEIELPEVVEVKLPRGKTIGGIVKNDHGEPVRTAKVYVNARVNENSGNSESNSTFVYVNRNVPTNKDGKWEMRGVPINFDSIYLDYSHSTHQPLSRNNNRSVSKSNMSALTNRTHSIVMKKGIVLTGTVTDEQGNPIEGALVTEGEQYESSGREHFAQTNTSGSFRYTNAREMNSVLTVMHLEYAPFQQKIRITPKMKPFDIVLTKGKKIEIKFVNPDDAPLPGVAVEPRRWITEKGENRKLRLLVEKNRDRFVSNERGVFIWEHAPEGEIDFNFHLTDYMYKGQSLATSDDAHQVLMMKQKMMIVKVVDAKSGKAIPEFRYTLGEQHSPNAKMQFRNWRAREGVDGEFVHTIDNNRGGYLGFKVKASGYKPAISETIEMKDITGESKTITIKMEEGFGPKGVILTADGKPAEGAQIAVYTADSNASISINNGQVNAYQNTNQGVSDKEGKYELEPVEDTYGLIVIHDAGYANLLGTEYEKSPGKIVLKSWVKVTGVLLEHGKPLAERQVVASKPTQHVEGVPRFYSSDSVETDADGRFIFERIMGESDINFGQRFFVETDRNSYWVDSRQVQLKVKSGEEYDITIGGKGRPVVGKILFPSGHSIMKTHHSVMQLPSAEQQSAQAFGGLVNLIQNSTGVDLGEAAKPKQFFQRNYMFTTEDDGSFRIEEMLPGKYQLHAYLREKRSDGGWGRNIGNVNFQFEVPEMEEDVSLEPLDIGELPVQLQTRRNRF